MDCTNKNCPAYAKCLAPYRGSRCKATRATYGLGDPLTNADRIRAMTDEELARETAWLIVEAMKQLHPLATWKADDEELISGTAKEMLDWLKQEATNV